MTQGKGRIGAVASVVALAIAFGGASTTRVTASNFGSSNCGPDLRVAYCLAPNYYHTVYLGYLRSDLAADHRFVLDYTFDDDTDLTAVEDRDTNADVLAFSRSHGDTGYHGATYCPSGATRGGTNPNVWCRPQYIRYNLYYSSVFNSSTKRRAIACHEVGHTVGLRHSVNVIDSCMHDPSGVNTLDLHDIEQINRKY